MLLDSPPYRLISEPPAAPALPPKGGSFADPNFGTTLVRLTDETDGRMCSSAYGIWSPFNSDYTKILIQCDGLFKLVAFDPVSGSVGEFSPLPASFQGSDAIWSHEHPELLYHRDGGSRLMVLDVSTGYSGEVHDFAKDFPDSPNLTRMSASADDNVFCFARQTKDYKKFAGFCVYTWSTGKIQAEPPTRIGNYFKVQIDKSGLFMWDVATDPESEWWELKTQGYSRTQGTGHSAMLTGKIVQYDNRANMDILRNMAKSEGINPGIAVFKWPDWSLATEYSGTDADEDWYAVTAAYNPFPPPGVTNWPSREGPLHDELLQIATDGSGKVRRLCHMFNEFDGTYESLPQPSPGYGAFPWIAFHSSWGKSVRRDVFLAKTGVSKPASSVAKPVIRGIIARNFFELYGDNLAGKSVLVSVDEVPAVLDYVSASQVNIRVPVPLIGKGKTSLIVVVDGIAAEPWMVVV